MTLVTIDFSLDGITGRERVECDADGNPPGLVACAACLLLGAMISHEGALAGLDSGEVLLSSVNVDGEP